MNAFEFATATQIIFGAGRVREIGPIIRQCGKRALVVIGKSAGAVQRAEPVLAQLDEYATFSLAGEPTVAVVQQGVERARTEACDVIISCGGGSVIDAGKAIAALRTNPGDPLDYLEVIGHGRPLTQPPLAFIAIPTTAGTGAEVTRNAVLGSPEHRVKVSLRSPLMLPRVALVDPELTHGLPPAITASTGLDALTQLIEPYLSTRANPLTDAFCREGLARVARSLAIAYAGDEPTAREDMSVASLLGGLALANAGLGAVHGFAGPIGGMFEAPHGAVCAALLPHVLGVNERALRERASSSAALGRLAEIRQVIGNVGQLVRDLSIPGLSQYGIGRNDLSGILDKARSASSMRSNPVVLTELELREILERALASG